MGSVPTQDREEFEYLFICSGNSVPFGLFSFTLVDFQWSNAHIVILIDLGLFDFFLIWWFRFLFVSCSQTSNDSKLFQKVGQYFYLNREINRPRSQEKITQICYGPLKFFASTDSFTLNRQLLFKRNHLKKSKVVNTFKYHVLCTDGKISVGINLLFYLYLPLPFHLTVVCFCSVALTLLIQYFQQVLWVLNETEVRK